MRRALLVVGLAGLTIMSGTFAGAGPAVDRATGGGQFLVGVNSPNGIGVGPGSTIGFNAQGNEASAKGQVQVIDREPGTGQSQVRFHGVVTCIDAEMNFADIVGHAKGSPGDLFSLLVLDNGQGAAADNDGILFDDMPSNPECDVEDEDEDDTIELARGNTQVYDGE
jgi:hypothetical protein